MASWDRRFFTLVLVCLVLIIDGNRRNLLGESSRFRMEVMRLIHVRLFEVYALSKVFCRYDKYNDVNLINY